MHEEWFDVTRRASAFEIQLSSVGHYRYRSKIGTGSQNATDDQQWHYGRPPFQHGAVNELVTAGEGVRKVK